MFNRIKNFVKKYEKPLVMMNSVTMSCQSFGVAILMATLVEILGSSDEEKSWCLKDNRDGTCIFKAIVKKDSIKYRTLKKMNFREIGEVTI